jgi:hypothetical protein
MVILKEKEKRMKKTDQPILKKQKQKQKKKN